MFKTVILLSLALGGAALGERVRMEPDVDVFSAPSWTRGARVSATDSLKVQFMMQHSDSQRASLEARLMDAATPSSANYGKWLSGEEVSVVLFSGNSSPLLRDPSLLPAPPSPSSRWLRRILHRLTLPVRRHVAGDGDRRGRARGDRAGH